MRLSLSLLLALAVVSPPSLRAQGAISTSLSLTANPGSVVPGQSTMLTAMLTVASGPISATDGLTIEFQTPAFNASSTLSNGVAQFSFTPSCGGPNGRCDNQVFVSFLPQGNFGPSSASITITLLQPTLPNLSGVYAFRFSGRSVLDGRDTDVGVVGTMMSDGNGNLTGIEDVNTSAGMFSSLGLTGTYTLDQNDTGTMTLMTSVGTQTFSLYLPSTLITAVPSGTFIETDGLVEGQGVLLKQDQNGITYALANVGSSYALNYGKGTYGIDGRGTTACFANECALVGHEPGPVWAAGQLTLSTSGAITGQVGESIETQQGAIVAVTGTASAFDSNGRMPFTVLVPGGASDQPSNFIAYLIDSYHFFYVSTDPAIRDILLVGTAAQKP